MAVRGRGGDPGHRRRLRRRVRRHRVEGAQRPQPTSPRDTRALVETLLSEHDYVAPAPRRLRRGAPSRPSSSSSTAISTPTRSRSSRASLDAAAEIGVAVVVSTPRQRPRQGTAGAGLDLGARPGRGRAARRDRRDERADRGRPRRAVAGRSCRSSSSTRSTCRDARLTSVGSTNFAGGLAATQHLLSLGHRRIAYVGGPATAACNQARHARLPRRHGGRDAPVPPGYVRTGALRLRDRAWPAEQRCSTCRPPTAAFVAGSDEMALGVIEAARLARSADPRRTSASSASTTPSSPGWPRRR